MCAVGRIPSRLHTACDVVYSGALHTLFQPTLVFGVSYSFRTPQIDTWLAHEAVLVLIAHAQAALMPAVPCITRCMLEATSPSVASNGLVALRNIACDPQLKVPIPIRSQCLSGDDKSSAGRVQTHRHRSHRMSL